MTIILRRSTDPHTAQDVDYPLPWPAHRRLCVLLNADPALRVPAGEEMNGELLIGMTPHNPGRVGPAESQVWLADDWDGEAW